MTKESFGITSSQYNDTFNDISKIYEQSLREGNDDWNKAVLTSNWKIGLKIIEVTQEKKSRATYGNKILHQLSKDLNRKYQKGFSESNLRYFRKFYLDYKTKRFYSELSWTHYVSLLQIENSKDRLHLEKLAIQKKLTSRNLENLVKQKLLEAKNKSKIKLDQESKSNILKKPNLQLYTYRITRKYKEESKNSIPHLDLGFSILLEEKEKIAKFKMGSILLSSKDTKAYSFELNDNPKELFTYKAYLERVIDGDTILVNIDLGFSISVEQRLRLRGLDAPEINTAKGILSKRFVESTLKDCKFLILKTHGKDKYDRYLVDVFYIKNETSEEKVINEGIFLNNELLEKNYAEIV
jgi:endonuclease YncB( thermonuclease family)